MVCKIMGLLCIISSEPGQRIQKAVKSAATDLPDEVSEVTPEGVLLRGSLPSHGPARAALLPAHQPDSPPSCPNTDAQHQILKPQLPAHEDLMCICHFHLTFTLFDTFINQHHYAHFEDGNPDT